MDDQPVDNVMAIYSEYVKRRKQGSTMETVIRELQSMADQLTRRERQQLSQFVQAWEGREGLKYATPRRAAGPNTATASAPQISSTLPNPIRPTLPVMPDPGQVRRSDTQPGIEIQADESAPAADLTEQKQLCPNCGKPNNKQETYCYACGHILAALKPGTKALDNDLDPETRWGTAHLGQASTVLLYVQGAAQPIEVNPKGELIIGRSSSDNVMCPDIDLAPYNGEDLGVSRLHAALKRTDNTISISDLDSKNHTYINGQRLHSHEIRVLHDGDEIRLGRLKIKITFKHQIRRLGT